MICDLDSDKTEEKTEPTLKPNRKIISIIESKKNNEMSPQFVVTLDGVDHNKYQNSDRKASKSMVFCLKS